jgi:hypothetical protein
MAKSIEEVIVLGGRALDSLDEDKLERLIKTINLFEFDNPERITEYESECSRIGISVENARFIIRILGLFIELQNDKPEGDDLAKLKKAVKQEFSNEEEWTKVWERFEFLLKRLDHFAIARKSQDLRDNLDAIEDFSIVCDVRPVFNLARTEIGRFLYPVILKLVDKSAHKFRFEIDEEQLNNVICALVRAQKKIQILKGKFDK